MIQKGGYTINFKITLASGGILAENSFSDFF